MGTQKLTMNSNWKRLNIAEKQTELVDLAKEKEEQITEKSFSDFKESKKKKLILNCN